MKRAIVTLICLGFVLTSIAAISPEWVNAPASKVGNDAVVAVDAFGYIYVAGTYQSTSNGKDWKIIKYSPDSNIVWTQTKNGSSNSDDYVYAIAVDPMATGSTPSSINVYVTGSLYGSNGSDCGTIKITSSGVISWTATYNGSANTTDIGKDVIVDGSGNVYVAGECRITNNGKDILALKYNSSGTQQWASTFNKNSGDYDDAASAMCFDASGNIIVAGYASNSTNKDAITVKYTTSGTKSWDIIYAGSSALDDWANDVVSDNSSNIYIAGKATHTTNLGDYLVVKYNSSGARQWSAIYDGPARVEDEAASLVISSGYIYVTGKSKGTSSSVTTFDYATIKYDDTGTVSWTNRYNGAANGDDAAVKIIADYAGDLIITGTSTVATSGIDYYTICYNASGSSLWTKRYYNPSYNGSDYATGIASDDFGNIYVTGTGSFGSTSDKFLTIKYSDISKNETVITGLLEKLTRGLLPESDNDTIKDIVYESCALSLDSFYHIRVDSLIARATSAGLDLKARMNTAIKNHYTLGDGDHVGKILSMLWKTKGFLTPAFVEVPYYASFVGTSTINNNPFMTYSHLDDSYPIPCINCEDITLAESQAATALSWTLVLNPGPRLNKYYTLISNCIGLMHTNAWDRCQVCPTVTTVDGIAEGSGSNLQHHEIEIQLGKDNSAIHDACADVIETNITGTKGYARLYKLAGFIYWDRIGDSDYRQIKKATLPIRDRQHYGSDQNDQLNWRMGDVLTLCEHTTKFNSSDENKPGIRFALSMGGVYQLNRPGINQQPVYFAFPFAKGLWYGQGPDMRVYYGTSFSNPPQYCTTNGPQDIAQDNQIKGCEFCIYYNSFANGGVITQANVTDYLASTDYATISGYWLANAVTVGFLAGSSAQADPDNVLYFTPNNPATCTPPTTGLIESLLVTESSNESFYEVFKPFDYANYPNNQTYPAGTNLRVHVRARFANGNVIDQCQNLTLDANTNSYSTITAEIRGNINNYSSSQVSYRIDVYLLP